MHSDKTLLYTTQYFSNKPRLKFASLKSNSKFKKKFNIFKKYICGSFHEMHKNFNQELQYCSKLCKPWIPKS